MLSQENLIHSLPTLRHEKTTVIRPWVRSRAPGTFGELVQGKLGATPFLITLPINRFSYAQIYPSETQTKNSQGLVKCERLIGEFTRLLGLKKNFEFKITSSLPHGKGLASSSADIVALGSAILTKIGIGAPFQAELICKAAKSIEPTDGIMYPGIVAFAHHRVRILKNLGFLKMKVIGVLEEGTVDTIDYDSKSCLYRSDETDGFMKALSTVEEGLRRGSVDQIGSASTRSAEINQRFLPKKSFTKFTQIQKHLNLPGIVVAHSGTAIGLLISGSTPEIEITKIRTEVENRTGLRTAVYETFRDGPTAVNHIASVYKHQSKELEASFSN